jgi:hypothetical protein
MPGRLRADVIKAVWFGLKLDFMSMLEPLSFILSIFLLIAYVILK